jgi:ribose transport system substrate-binding protein
VKKYEPTAGRQALQGEPAASRLQLLLEPRVLTAAELVDAVAAEQPW